MKHLIKLIVVALPAIALAGSPFVTGFKTGRYEGAFKSIVPQLNGQKCAVDLKSVTDNLEATVNCGTGENASREVWTWNDKTLTQKELDVKTGAVTRQYTAVAAGLPAVGSQTYQINCKDRATNQCDAGIDSRHTWTIRSTGRGLEYQVVGVNPEEKANLAAKPIQRHLLSATIAQ